MENNKYPFINLPLPYEYNALEPYIDEKTMELHHDKHLGAYINNLNEILTKNPKLQKFTLEQLIYSAAKLPKKLQAPVRNNAGGVYNHRFYFDLLKNPADEKPHGALSAAIDAQFGSFENFSEKFRAAAMSVFGSGYAWLVNDRGELKIITTKNQDNPIEKRLCPIIAIDVWEHAYYLKHYNVRVDYINDWFKIINWQRAEENYKNCL